jgi:hypothetical protein
MSPKKPEPEDDEDDTSEKWKHDDPTEQSPKQRRASEVAELSRANAHTYAMTKLLWEQICASLRKAQR